MSSGRKWVLASSNEGKLAELRTLLAELDLELHLQSEFAVRPAPENAPTFVENALGKARHAADVTGLPAFADDSGLCVDALDGAPGLHTARFAGPSASDDANIDKLLAALEGVPAPARGAHYYCAIAALKKPDDPSPLIVTGRWNGRIATARAGRGGFGYDPVFYVESHAKTAAEMAPATKHSLSHRGQALAELRDRFAAYAGR